ncbi:IQ motif, EF-hand binding site-containing protein [Cynara cardunculus var. scolymus]|uniref:IQ motif, EF-hand binding site-containing protein n=1 Tax=Cynara cardunculus var. scolymus TaxID=59895 RepID=A0A103XL28_CYNCS|nr:IQ motif, EF-hand binding site-containing protein [Cynara cardunculus var. scolymus]
MSLDFNFQLLSKLQSRCFPVPPVIDASGEHTQLEKSSSANLTDDTAENARRAFWALKGIIRLQALVRGHLVRRQAVATLSCMRAIVEFQALVRGQKARLSENGQMLQKKTPRELVN